MGKFSLPKCRLCCPTMSLIVSNRPTFRGSQRPQLGRLTAPTRASPPVNIFAYFCRVIDRPP